MKIWGFHCRRLFGGLLVAGMVRGLMPSACAEEPQWFKLNGPPEVSTGMELDSSTEDTRVGGTSSTYEHLFITPTVGLRTQGSIYHPNLLTFDLNGELGWGWDTMTTKTAGVSQTINESQDLLRYLAQVNILSAKPYNASFFASQDHTYQDFGSIDTFTVDTTQYGGRINWSTESFNLLSDMGYRDEKYSGLNDSSEVAETYFNFTGINHRRMGQTTLTYHINQFDNTFNFGTGQRNLNQSVGLSDAERFGSRSQFTAATSASYSQSEYGAQRTETISGNENITANLRPKLDSYLLMNFSHSRMNPVDVTSMQGVGGLQHQLYESLVSHFDLHGNYQDNSGPSSTSSSDRYGVELSENYTKRLSSWGRLTANSGVVADHEDDRTSGGLVWVPAEEHQLFLPTSPNYHPVYLSLPLVVQSSIQVSVGGQILSPTNEYLIVQSGDLTEIQLVSPPDGILAPLLQGPDHDFVTVTVSYQSQPLNNASFDTLSARAQIRLDLFDRFGIYGRMNWSDNNAPPEVLVQSLTDLVGGVNYHRHWFRAGAEYEDYDSNFSRYQAGRLYQGFNFQPTGASTLSVNFNESFYRYPANRSQDLYQTLTRYNIRLSASLAWNVEGGYSMQDLLGTEQVVGLARTDLTWSRGKLSLRTGYEYNSQTTTSALWTEERVKQRVYLYLKRTF